MSGRLGLPGWPGIAEESIVARDVMLARHTGSRVHVAHVSTAGTVEVIRWAKAQGIDVTAEVTPHHLALTTDLLVGYDPVYKVNPPLRPREDVEALRAALVDGTIDAVATDHAPHARHDKEHAFADAAFGMLGLETALSVVSEVLVRPGLLDWAGVARVMSTAPARIGGLAAQGRSLPSASRHTSRSSTPTARSPSTRRRAAAARATTPGTAAPSAARSRRPSMPGASRTSAGDLAHPPTTDDRDTGGRPVTTQTPLTVPGRDGRPGRRREPARARARGRPHLPGLRPTARSARPSARRSSRPA